MPILPIDTGRYGTPEMLKIFDEEGRLQRMLDVEAALALVQADVGDVPKEDAKRIAERASTKYVRLERVKEVEREIKHDIMAMVKALAEACGPSGAYVHLGATSFDIVDTATALQMRDALDLIGRKLEGLKWVLMEGAERYKNALMIGRTHGQHALPTTLGFKFAVWLGEVCRHIERLAQCRERVIVGKMSGAVGTQAGFGPHALVIQELTMKKLGLRPADISTQIVQRDRYAELICLLALIASTLENIATEVRNLQRTEIAEVFEPFERAKQVGSSTMPHKRNPELCERICGLARIVRSLVIPALENVTTWHERDLTQSSAERFIIPEAFIIVDYMLDLMTKVLSGLEVDEEKMLQNLELTKGRIMSESVMIALVRKGMSRQKAHEILRGLSWISEVEGRPFKEVLIEDEAVKALLSEEEIEEALDPRNYLGTAVQQVESVVKRSRLVRIEDPSGTAFQPLH